MIRGYTCNSLHSKRELIMSIFNVTVLYCVPKSKYSKLVSYLSLFSGLLTLV